MSPNQLRVTLDDRRGWARVRAVVVCLVGIGVIALSAAMLALVVLAAVARFWTWLRRRDIESAGVWGIATEAAVGAGVIAVIVSFAIFFWWFWTGAVDVVLREVNAERVDEPKCDGQRRTMNLLEELSIGLGRPIPELWVTKDEIPNALSMRSSKRRVVCTTTGVASLPRDELEAMLAHELGHVWALDAHWVASGMVALARGRRAGLILLTSGAVMLVLVLAGWRSVGILWSTSLFAVALMVLGAICTSLLRRLEMNMRRNADVIADVAALKLARNPGSLAALFARLAEDDGEVSSAGWRSELMWFEMVEAADLAGDKDPEAKIRSRRELVDRALAAYAQAGKAVPAEQGERFERWFADHPMPGQVLSD
jgi:Zn-dependent protease with chaperone function